MKKLVVVIIALLLAGMLFNAEDRAREDFKAVRAQSEMTERTAGGEFFDPKEFIVSYGYDSVGQNPANKVSSKGIFRKYVLVNEGYAEFTRTISSSYTKGNRDVNFCEGKVDLSREFLTQHVGQFTSIDHTDFGNRGGVSKCVFILSGAGDEEITMFASGDDSGAYHVFVHDGSQAKYLSPAEAGPVISSNEAQNVDGSSSSQLVAPYSYISNLHRDTSSGLALSPEIVLDLRSASILKSKEEIGSLVSEVLRDYRFNTAVDAVCRQIWEKSVSSDRMKSAANYSYKLIGSSSKDGFHSCAYEESAPYGEQNYVLSYEDVGGENYSVVYFGDPR